MIQYTNMRQWGQHIYERGIDCGHEYQKRTRYEPTLFTNSHRESKFKSLISKENLTPRKFDCIRDAKDWIDQEKDVEGKTIHGMDNYAIQYMHDRFPEPEVKYDLTKVRVFNIDIEVNSSNIEGFPHPKDALSPITAITIYDGKRWNTWGFDSWEDRGEYKDNVIYHQCGDEKNLIAKFLQFWTANPPHVITGWNVDHFDMPYIYNRISNVIGEKVARHLSPFKVCAAKDRMVGTREMSEVMILGIDQLDYIELYKKYTYAAQESYRLDHIANIELGEKKLDYSEVKNLIELEEQNYDKFLRYNVKDVELVKRIDDKLKLIDLHMTVAYQAKLSFSDVYSPVKTWDSIIYHHLYDKNIVVPINRHQQKGEFPGAYVKTPLVGFHEWIVSFDLASLYPSLIRQFNISPETLIDEKLEVTVDDLITKTVDTSRAHDLNCALTATGSMYRKDEQGVFPHLMEWLYNQRKTTKNQMLDYQKEMQKHDTDSDEYKKISILATQFNNKQMAAKILLNSAYGALGNQYFRFFDLKLASSITLSGQLSIRWIADRLNLYFNNMLNDDKDRIIAIDTDSNYVDMSDIVSKFMKDKSTTEVVDMLDNFCKDQVEPHINKCYDEMYDYTNSIEQLMIMDREGISDKGFWTAKKRYALRVHDNEGVRYSTPKIKIMGLDLIKSSTPEKIRAGLKKTLPIIFDGTNAEVLDFIDAEWESFQSLEPQDIAFPRSVNGIKKWSESVDGVLHPKKGCPIHVRGAIIFNRLLKKGSEEPIGDAEKIKFIYLKEPNHAHTHVLAFRDGIPEYFDLERSIDYDLQFEKTFLQPIKGILTAIGWDWERKATLESFFS